ncbi:MAG: PilZ domain-containing protein [Bryobacteraceae bacterium]|nr:PilZ domain-containing protein [Bryobacteraceae bacterium]
MDSLEWYARFIPVPGDSGGQVIVVSAAGGRSMAGVFSMLRMLGFGGVEPKADRRREERFGILEPVTIKVLGSNPEVLQGILLNVSAHGMRVQTGKVIVPGSCLEVSTSEAMLLGEVCYCIPMQDRFEVGVDVRHSLVDVKDRVLFRSGGASTISDAAAAELKVLLSVTDPRKFTAAPESERRNETRYSISTGVKVKTVHPRVTQWCSAELWDISRTGVGLHVREAILPGSQIAVASGALVIFAEARHCRAGTAGGYFVGAKIIDVFDEQGNAVGDSLDLECGI